MSIYLSAFADRRRMCRVGGGVGALAVLLATALSTPAAAAAAPVPDISPNQQVSIASELPQAAMTSRVLSSAAALSDPQAEQNAETTPDGESAKPDDSADAANHKDEDKDKDENRKNTSTSANTRTTKAPTTKAPTAGTSTHKELVQIERPQVPGDLPRVHVRGPASSTLIDDLDNHGTTFRATIQTDHQSPDDSDRRPHL